MKSSVTITTVVFLILAIIGSAIGISFLISGKSSTEFMSLQNEKRKWCAAYVKYDPFCNLNQNGIASDDAPEPIRLKLIDICNVLKYKNCEISKTTGITGDDLKDECTQNCCHEFCK